ncbi:hypothetical protein D3C76_1244900 [compost metagenome]
MGEDELGVQVQHLLQFRHGGLLIAGLLRQHCRKPVGSSRGGVQGQGTLQPGLGLVAALLVGPTAHHQQAGLVSFRLGKSGAGQVVQQELPALRMTALIQCLPGVLPERIAATLLRNLQRTRQRRRF